MKLALAFLLLLPRAADDWSDFEKLSRDKDPAERCKAVDRIDKYKDAKMVQALFPLLADDHPRVRSRAVRAVGRCSDDAVIEFVATKGLKESNPKVRHGLAEALGWIRNRKAVPGLLDALGDSSAEVRAEVCLTLAWMRESSAAGKLHEKSRDPDGLVRANALEALARMKDPKVGEPLAAAPADKDFRVRIAAAAAWGGFARSACKFTKDQGAKRDCDLERTESFWEYPGVDPQGALAGLPKLLQDKDWRVRAAAIEACRGLRERACVGWLVDLLEKEKGRLRWDALVALVDLTGKEIGLDPKAWKSWWEANKDSFEVKKDRSADGKGAGGGKTVATFFKVPIYSTAVVFILDLSGSMRDAGVDGEGQKAGSKLDIAKKGMIETIRNLPADTRFMIVCLGSTKDGVYDRKQKTLGGRLELVPATPGNKQIAEKWVNDQKAKGYTNIYDAIEYAMGCPDADTVFLYTDGGASTGAFVYTDEILPFVQKGNRFSRIMINTVEIPAEKPNTADNIRLLTELATHTCGTHKLYVGK